MMTTAEADFVIVGSGIAGLRAALALGPGARTVVLTKEAVSESATQYAQGGIAVAMGEDDTVALHEQDTLAAGDGLCSPQAVRTLVEEGPGAIEELLAWGADFDRDLDRAGGGLARTREAAHSRSRILHAHGDSTGREIAATLARRAAGLPRLRLVAHGRATRLLQREGRVVGIEYQQAGGAERRQLAARAVLLATGGLGQLYLDTTNPPVATGDGPGLAYQAGAELADMEFVQFHPTALARAGAPRFLLSEALRGEGAVLRNPAGERFMERYHAAAELAPRDVVARALEAELRAAGAGAVCYLDASGLEAAAVRRRFPRIAATLAEYGLDLARDRIPVRPAAHYAMGGIATTLEGRSTLAGLYAAGECACTGVHGANRLASNSLLEGRVFGARGGRAMASEEAPAGRGWEEAGAGGTEAGAGGTEAGAEMAALQGVMSACAGVVRRGEDLGRGLAAVEAMGAGLAATAGAAVLRAALARRESRGAHCRSDYPAHDAALAGLHSWQRRGQAVRFAPLP